MFNVLAIVEICSFNLKYFIDSKNFTMNVKTLLLMFCCVLRVKSMEALAFSENDQNLTKESQKLRSIRDVFSYFWMTEEAKYKLFVQSLIEEFQRKLAEEKEREKEKKLEIERQIYRDHLSSRVSGTILKDFLTVRY